MTETLDNKSDDYHTMQELYDHRNTLFVAILNHFPGGLGIRKIWKSNE